MLNPALEFSIGTQQVTKLLIEKKEQWDEIDNCCFSQNLDFYSRRQLIDQNHS